MAETGKQAPAAGHGGAIRGKRIASRITKNLITSIFLMWGNHVARNHVDSLDVPVVFPVDVISGNSGIRIGGETIHVGRIHADGF